MALRSACRPSGVFEQPSDLAPTVNSAHRHQKQGRVESELHRAGGAGNRGRGRSKPIRTTTPDFGFAFRPSRTVHRPQNIASAKISTS